MHCSRLMSYNKDLLTYLLTYLCSKYSLRSHRYSYTIAVATSWLLCQWYAGQSVAISQSVVLSDDQRHGPQTQLNQSHAAEMEAIDQFFLGNSVIIFLTPYSFQLWELWLNSIRFWQHFVNFFISTLTSLMTLTRALLTISNLMFCKKKIKLLIAAMDLYNIWWEWPKYTKAYASSITLNSVHVYTKRWLIILQDTV